MVSGIIILKVAGNNVRYDVTPTPIRELILELGDEDVASMQIERLYNAESFASPVDETKQFAAHWAKALSAADPVPAFLRHHCPELRAEFAA